MAREIDGFVFAVGPCASCGAVGAVVGWCGPAEQWRCLFCVAGADWFEAAFYEVRQVVRGAFRLAFGLKAELGAPHLSRGRRPVLLTAGQVFPLDAWARDCFGAASWAEVQRAAEDREARRAAGEG